MELKNRVALVTGGSGGIGSAACLAFAREGAAVAVHCLDARERAGEVVRAIEALGGRAVAVQGDISDVRDVERIMEEVSTFSQIGRASCRERVYVLV